MKLVRTLLKPEWTVESVNIDYSKDMGGSNHGKMNRKVSISLRDKRTTVVYFRGYDYEVAGTLCDLGIIVNPDQAEDLFSHKMKRLPVAIGWNHKE
jgi:TATA-binding protein-associated factor Taf7